VKGDGEAVKGDGEAVKGDGEAVKGDGEAGGAGRRGRTCGTDVQGAGQSGHPGTHVAPGEPDRGS
jgi:hypothetical protein